MSKFSFKFSNQTFMQKKKNRFETVDPNTCANTFIDEKCARDKCVNCESCTPSRVQHLQARKKAQKVRIQTCLSFLLPTKLNIRDLLHVKAVDFPNDLYDLGSAGSDAHS